MSKKNHGGRVQNSAFEFLRSGETVPKAFLERRIAAAKRELAERAKQRRGMSQRYATYWSQIQKASKDVKDRGAARAMEGILEIHKNLARKKLAASAPLGLGGIVTTTFGVRLTPPFDYAFTIVEDGTVGNPALGGSANKDTGQISTSAVTDYKAESDGVVYSEMGIYFRAKFGPATLLASTSPSFTYQWWTNSIKDSGVISSAAGAFGIYNPSIPKPYGEITYTVFEDWWENQPDELQFDFGTDLISPASFEVDNLSPSAELAVYVSTLSWTYGHGWPGSLAGAVISVAVPSITLELNPVLIAP